MAFLMRFNSMVCVNVKMKYSGAPLKRTPVELILDESNCHIGPTATDRGGRACFEVLNGSGRIMVAGIERYQGVLSDSIDIELRNLAETGADSSNASLEGLSGDTSYPGMTTRSLVVDNFEILTDSEGYLVDPADWCESFTRTQAALEGLELTQEHWDIIHFQRQWYAEHGRQASVRDMIRYFRSQWGKERGSNHYLHQLFPNGGPQKQGNRLAGLLRTKGEH
jgi:tRNA 2-thiouridine synthesizing protein E